MTAFLSTINTLTRGALISLFAGLFILVACGGGGTPLVALNLSVTPDLCEDPFASACLDAGETARTREFDDCQTTLESGTGDCKQTIPLVAITCLRNPFDTNCDINVYDREVRARLTNGDTITELQTSRIAECRTRPTGANFDKLCNGFANGATGGTIVDCLANPFNRSNDCNNNPGFGAERDARTTLCTATGTLFDSLCDNLDPTEGLNVERTRITLAEACVNNPQTEGCDVFINGQDGLTVAQCSANPSIADNNCNTDEAFNSVRSTRTSLCSVGAQRFNSLCDGYVDVSASVDIPTSRLNYCSNGATTFDANCNEMDYEGTDDARAKLVLACRGATAESPVAGCEQVVATVSENQQDVGRMVNDCIDIAGGDPYQTGCNNSLFEDDRKTRLVLCTQGANARDDAGCMNAIIEHSCISDPYITACLGQSNFDNARTLRRNYCKDEVETSSDALCNSSLVDAICDGAQPDDNPFSTLCGDPAVVTEMKKDFCALAGPAANNPLCSSDAATVCPDNPFNASFGIRRLVCSGANYAVYRIKQCSDGTQNDATLCNTTEIAPPVCAGTGANANPFAVFCAESLVNAGLADTDALDAEKLKFADACAGANTEGYSCKLAQATFCSAAGTYARPFATTCNDAALSETIGGIRATFCGTGDTGTTNNANCINAIGAVCVNNPFGSACVSPSVVELRNLRAVYCNSFDTAVSALADDLCTSDTANAVCKDGYGDVDASPFDLICGLNATYDPERTTACVEDMTGNLEVSRCPGLIMNFCNDSTASDGTNPFNSKCSSGDYDVARQAACKANLDVVGGNGCTTETQAVCGTATSPTITADNVNNNLCSRDDLKVARGKACAGIPDETERTTKCGTEISGGFLTDYCKTLDGMKNALLCEMANGTYVTTFCSSTNPFASFCDGNLGYIAHRSSRCVSSRLAENPVALPDGVTVSDCEAAEMLICDGGISGTLTVTGNLFDPICGDSYKQARAEACGPDADISVNSECPTIVGSFCGIDGNEFNDACANDSVAQGYRDIKCLATATDASGDCSDAYVRICTKNPFSTKNDGVNASICIDAEGTTYAESRKTACETNDDAKGANSETCAPVIILVCGEEDSTTKGADLFTEPLCNSDDAYNDSRKSACEDDIDVNQAGGCAATVELTCGVLGTPDVAKLFSGSSLCDDTYNADRETACSDGGGAEKAQCQATVTRICETEDKVFNSVCLHKDDVVDLRTNTCKTAYRDGCDTHTQFTSLCEATPLAPAIKMPCEGLGTTNDGYITNFCGDVNNSANAFETGCNVADYTGTDTTYDLQLDKACAEGGSAANDECTDKARAGRHCLLDAYAGTGCSELDGIEGIRTTYCTENRSDSTHADYDVECSGDTELICTDRPFDARCVDEDGATTLATLRKNLARDCLNNVKSGLVCNAVNACNGDPYGSAASGFTPTGGATMTCLADPAFIDARAQLITTCIAQGVSATNAKCTKAIADGVSCLENPHRTDVDCTSPEQLDSMANHDSAKANRALYCVEDTADVAVCLLDTLNIVCVASESPFATLCKAAGAGVTYQAERVTYCKVSGQTFHTVCDTLAISNGDVKSERVAICLANTDNVSRGTDNPAIANGILFDETLCGGLTGVASARVVYCKDSAQTFHTVCDTLAINNGEVRTERVAICLRNDANVNRGTDNAAIASNILFDEALCGGLTGVADKRVELCVNGTVSGGPCTDVVGIGFDGWDNAVSTGIIAAGGALAGNDNANFIRAQIKEDGILNLGEGITPDNQTILRLNDTGLSSDTDSGFVLASADFGGGNANLYVGLLHTTTRLGTPITDTTTTNAKWYGQLAILQQVDNGEAVPYNSDFVLNINFNTRVMSALVRNINNYVGVDFALVGASFDGTSGLISGTATFSKTTQTVGGASVYSADRTSEIYPTTTTETTEATLHGLIGTEGAVATFASGVTNNNGDIVGGFAVSPVTMAQSDCLNGNPFADGCATKVGCSGAQDETMCDLPVGQILTAQLVACTTGKLPDGTDTPNFESNCTDDANLTQIDPAGNGVQTRVRSVLSGALCSLDHENANPLAKICGSITADDIFYTDAVISGGETQHEANLRKTRAGIESACNNESPTLTQGDITKSIHENVCRRVALNDAKDAYDIAVAEADRPDNCVSTDLPALFGGACGDVSSLRLRRDYCYDIANAFDTTYCIVSDVVATGVDINTVRNNQAEACRFSGTGDYATIQSSDCMAQHIKDALCGADFTEVSNPFHATCVGYASIADTRSDFADACVNDKNSITNTRANCTTGNFALCITNPFATDASVPNEGHTDTQTCVSSPAFSRIQGEILESCRGGSTTYSNDCGNASTHTCASFVAARNPDLFIDPICRVNNGYDTARRGILDNCDTMGDCETFRKAHTNSDYLATDGRLVDCQDPALAVLDGCESVLDRPTTAAVLEAFDRNGDKVSTAGVSLKEQLLDTPSGGVGNEFLKGQLDTDSRLNTNSYVNKDGTTASAVYSVFRTFTLGQIDEASDYSRTAGVAYFAGRVSAVDDTTTDVRYFAGLLPYTDFGVALPGQYQIEGADVIATWNGHFGWVVYDATDAAGYTEGTDTGFALTVNFTDRTISGTATRTLDSLAFVVSGNYDVSGLIEGDINIKKSADVLERYTGKLIGVIGEFGAAGAFHAAGGAGLADTDVTHGAAGGFAVHSNNGQKLGFTSPYVRTLAYWGENAVLADDTTPINVLVSTADVGGDNLAANFIAGGADDLELGGLATGFTPTTLKLDDVYDEFIFTGLGINGVSFGSATVGGVTKFYAGLLSGIDRGALIAENAGTAAWKGRIGIDSGELTTGLYTASFTLNLNFGDNSFSSGDIAIDGTKFTSSTAGTLSFTGNYSNTGLIRGVTIYTLGATAHNGILSGFIGAEFAAAAFISDTLATSAYAGGFIASKLDNIRPTSPVIAAPTHAEVRYDDWAYNVQENHAPSDGLIPVVAGDPSRFGYLQGLSSTGALSGTTLGTIFGATGSTLVPDADSSRSGGADPAQNIPFRLALTDNSAAGGANHTTFGGSADDGLAYFAGIIGGVKNYHTGLFASTNVGTVLPPESNSEARVYWDGELGYVSRNRTATYNKKGAFRLVLNLNAKTFTVDRITFIGVGDGLVFSGGWNDFGVIDSGAVTLAGIPGTLTGVIGTQGAVGAFWGDNGNGGYAGGFVASGSISGIIPVPAPTSGKADYSYWAHEIQTRDNTIPEQVGGVRYLQRLSKSGALGTSTLDGGALRGEAGGENIAQNIPHRLALTDNSAAGGVNHTIFGGTADDGVAYFSGTQGGAVNYHTGLFDSTDVGNALTRLTGARIAYWNGELGIILGNNTNAIHRKGSFTLKINMSLGTFQGLNFSTALAGISFTGGWNANGVITNGQISRGTVSGTLTGLIGAQGAVGAFVSVDPGADQWVGGFVASAPAIATYQTYESYYNYYSARGGNTQVHTTTTAGGVTGFVTGTADELLDDGVGYTRLRGASCNVAAPCFKPFVVKANGDESSTNGFIMSHGTHTDYFDRYRVGILPTTDLGVNPNVGMATWNGNFYISSKLGEDGNPVATPFILNVNFVAGTLTSETTFSAIGTATKFTIEGLFGNNAGATRDGLARGLPGGFGGNVLFKDNNDVFVAGAGLTGLIGGHGAIGVFSNWSALNFVGGFEAFSPSAPPTPSTPSTALASRIYSAEVDLTNYVTITTRADRFLPTRPSVSSSEFTHLNHPNTLIADQGLGFDSSLAHCGVGKQACYSHVYYLNGTGSGTNAFYLLRSQAPGGDGNWYRAGILHSTNLGARPTTGNATFNGRLYISKQIDDNGNIGFLPIRFNVDFTNSRITQPTPVNLPAEAGHSLALGNVFFNSNGVLNGGVLYKRTGERDIIMAMSGLIGTNAVLGVFHSSAFATRPLAKPLGVILGGFWANNGTPPPTVAVTGFDFGTVADFSENVVFGNTAGPTCTDDTPCFNTTVRLSGDVNSPNGFGLYHGYHATSRDRYRAGLLPGTDLGRVSTIGSATWDGSIYTSNNFDADGNPEAITIKLGVDFALGTITTSAPITVIDGDAATKETIEIDGRFGAHADAPATEGALGGVVNYKIGAAAAVPLTLIGAIGRRGVLGVFHGTASKPLVGGFEARHIPPRGSIQNPTITVNKQGGQILLDSAPFNTNTVLIANGNGAITVPVTVSGGLTDADLGGFYSFVSRNTTELTQNVAYYTGLLDGVAEKVGDVLPAMFSDGMTTATWNGTFAMYYGSGRGFQYQNVGAGSFSHQALELTVNLGSKSFRAPAQFSYGGQTVTSFNGKWNEFGAITEAEFFTRGVPGTIQGFIGVNGIVGVVVSTVPNANTSYAGGFIAKPE